MNNTTGQQYRQHYATTAFSSEISAHIGTQKMNDEIFSRLVAEEVKNRVSESQRLYLELPENQQRWKRALLALMRNLQSQIDSISQDKELDIKRYSDFGVDGEKLLVEATASYDLRIGKIERFKMFVEKRLDYAVSLSETKDSSERLKFLESAINKHRQLFKEFDIEADDADLALWAALDGRWMFDEVTFNE